MREVLSVQERATFNVGIHDHRSSLEGPTLAPRGLTCHIEQCGNSRFPNCLRLCARVTDGEGVKYTSHGLFESVVSHVCL